MSRSNLVLLMLLAALCLRAPLPTAHAAIVITGHVDPADPGDWNGSTNGYVGKSGYGALEVNGDSDLDSRYGYIGYEATATGEVTVSGAGSTWTNSGVLAIGDYGNGTLDITSGGAVNDTGSFIGRYSGSTGAVTVSGGATWTSGSLRVGLYGDGTLDVTYHGVVSSTGGCIGYDSSATGAVTLSGAGSTWTNSGYLDVGCYGDGTLNIADRCWVQVGQDVHVARYAGSAGAINFDIGLLTTGGFLGAFADLSGTGTINTNGLVSDVDLVFDATHGLAQTFWLNGPGQDITVNLNVDGSGSMGAGYSGNHSLDISDGVTVQSAHGYLGYQSGSTGAATVSGAGSIWTNSGSLYLGCSGDGALNIADGALVEVGEDTHVAQQAGSAGAINFDNGTLTTRGFLGAVADLSGTGTINTNGLVSDVDLVFDATHGRAQTLTLSGPGRDITVNLDVDGSGSMGAGHGGHGSLHISDGVIVQSTYGYLGYESGSTGVAALSGAGSSWTNSRNLRVGCYGDGALDVTDGGAVSSINADIGRYAGSTGVATVSGAGATWTSYSLAVGTAGDGTLDVTNGAAVSNTNGYIGYDSGSSGAVTVSGAGSTWTNSSSLYVGLYGHGTLDITDGGSFVDMYRDYIGYGSGSTGAVTVSGAGSTWTNNSRDLYVGYYGDGTLHIADGGAVSNTDVYIGCYSGSTGAVTVSGPGSTWTNNGSLYVAAGGTGTLTVQNGGTVNVTDTLKVWDTGTVHVDGTLAADRVSSDGTLSGSGTIGANAIEITGVVSPGSSVGMLTVDGEMELIEGTYLCEIDATGADLIHNANDDEGIFLSYEDVGGTLELLVLEALGDPGCYAETILSTSGAGEIVGDFADGQRPAEGDYLDYGVFLDSYETVNTGAGFNYTLNLFQAGQGDTDGDGDVDLDDLSALDDGWDPTAEDKIWTDGDVDGDGDVDLDDLSLLDDAWAPAGYPVVNCPFAGGGAGAAAVPEPGTLLLLGMGAICLLAYAGRKRRCR